MLEGHQGWVRAVAFSPEGDRVVSAGFDGTVCIWRLTGVELQKVIRAATPLCLDPDFRERSLGDSPKATKKKYEACELERGRVP